MACLSGTIIIAKADPSQTAPMTGLTALSGQMVGVSGNPLPVNRVDLSTIMQSQLVVMDEFAKFKEEVASMMKNTLETDMSNSELYQKSYKADFDFDSMSHPPGWHVPDFVKFSGEDNRTTWEHMSQYIAQLGDVGTHDSLKVCLFCLSLTGTAFLGFVFSS
jgi:hypothetical protein